MKITFKIFPLSKWQIYGQKPPVNLPRKDRNQIIMNSKWQQTVTCNTGIKLQFKGKSGKAQTQKLSDGNAHLMLASLSRRDTLFKRISITFRKTTSRQQYGNQNSSPKSLLSSGSEQDLNLGQSPKTRLHWPLDLPSLSSLDRNHGAPPK
jgi:hypothetical protein